MSQDVACPCGSGRIYSRCCQRYHLGEVPDTAEALMRSRYCAYVYRLADYLLCTWHADTRPATLPFEPASQAPRWLGLKIIGAQTLDDNHALVEFVARFRHGGGGAAQRLHERSRFVREHGRWFYIDGDIFS